MSKDKLTDEYAPSTAYQRLFSKPNKYNQNSKNSKNSSGNLIRKNYRYEGFKKHLLSKRIEAYIQQIEEEQAAFRTLAFEKITPIFQADNRIFFQQFETWKNDKELQDGYPKIFKAFIQEADRRQDLEYHDFIQYLDKNNHKLRHITFLDYE